MIFRSIELSATDHRLVVATLQLSIMTRKISRCCQTMLCLEKQKISVGALEYAVLCFDWFSVLSPFEDIIEQGDT